MLEAAVIVIGDEILGGFVVDANSGWLAQQLREDGVPLTRIQVVPDDADAIDEALSTELDRSRPRLVITSGGVGSTPDDITYAAVAASLGRELVVDPLLAERVEGALRWTASHGIEVDEEFRRHMLRMAEIPSSATLLAPDSGWAPGVRVDVDGGVDAAGGATVVILPGVPAQLRTLYRRGVAPQLVAGRNEPPRIAELTHGFPESALNPCFARLREAFPGVRVGSYPGVPMLVRLCGPPDDVETALAELERYVRDLERDPAGARLQRGWAARLGAVEQDGR